MKFLKTALLATSAISMFSAPALATINELSPNPIEGVTITTNNDGTSGEPFTVTQGGTGSSPGPGSTYAVFQADNTIGSGNDLTTVQNLDNVVINANSDGSTGTNASVALQVGNSTGVAVVGTGNAISNVNIDTSNAATTNIGSGGTGDTNIGNSTGNATIIGATASLNATGTGNTNIGNSTNGGTVGITSSGTGAVNINANTGAATVTNIGTGNTTGAINIGNGTDSGAIGIGNSLSTTNILGATNINTSGNKTTDIGTGGTGVVNIGNTTGGTAVTGPLTVTTPDGSGGSNSLAVGATQTTTVGVNTVSYGTTVNGGMLVNGDLGVNGNIYSLNPTANASVNVANNGLTITGATNSVGLVSDSDANAANGRAQVALTPTTAALEVTNSLGNTHGVFVGTDSTVISGGTSSTSLTFDNAGAHFQNTVTGGPAQVTGVADGTSRYDAVNYGQLQDIANKSYGGISSAIAMSNIPQVDQGKTFAIGIGYGNFDNGNSMAFGGSIRVADAAVIKASVGSSTDGETSVGAGVAYSW